MYDVPPIFVQRFSVHNRYCWGAALASLFAAWLAWMFCGVIFTGAVLIFEVIRTGDVALVDPPWWYFPTGLFLILGNLLWAGVDRWWYRFRSRLDRSIIGWHLIPEMFLLPSRLTFAIGDHLEARIKLTSAERREGWHLLRVIWQTGRTDVGQMGGELSRPQLLTKLLPALQLTDWIDLHNSEGDWYYRVRSDQVEVLRELLPELPPAPEYSPEEKEENSELALEEEDSERTLEDNDSEHVLEEGDSERIVEEE